MPPAKLQFKVVNSSGEDPDSPARELHHHSPQSRGWQCPRFAKFPQELTLQLSSPAMLSQIQILSHEHKIASKIEIYVGTLQPGETDYRQCRMKRLGYLSFDSNEKSAFKARELKSVHVNTAAHVMRLVLHKCHINKLNIYNQVGIIAVNVIGEHLNLGGNKALGGAAALARAPREVVDVALDMNVDVVTAEKIREILLKKEAAVAREDYDEAKRLKAGIDKLKVVGMKVAQLEAQKQAAVEMEDYDTAKMLKKDIEHLRST
eukprot:CAMPEP_0118939966 /NCGR_PEP_ID=MMETSP1169-20130426/30302_1 /TAXON_ID=36882 /ORGANISM="Pyramimonas obovata, Strain CCMP722" /LENGTH=261 /DNA_ID=CAMNT_0006884353 /DNA_START=264 /DNA_END=1045 /DNA_ORIENTATION=+